MDIKENLAKNLTYSRKALGLTQAELAEKINYSDKAVSKWERGEAVPDLAVLYQLSRIYGVSVDSLLSDKLESKPMSLKNVPKKRFILSGVGLGVVWLLVILCYCFIGVLVPSLLKFAWLSFVIAVPLNILVLLIFTSIWGKNLLNAVFTSLFVWALISTLYIVFVTVLSPVPSTLWLIFLIGIPLQVLIFLWFFYKKVK